MPRPRKRTRAMAWLFRVLALLAVGFAALLVWSAIRVASFDVASLAREKPRETALMRERAREARRSGRELVVRARWVPLEQVSPLLRRAVLIAEDDAFFSHDGLDWNEIEASAKRNWQAGRIVRGGSTITQQLAKNLWLGSARSPVRKIEEVLLAIRLERTLSKRRIFELYLNVIEWGDGVYGAEAAARHWYGVSASGLSSRQAIVLAAVIINPRRYSPTAPTKRIERRVRMITRRMDRRGPLPAPAPIAPPPTDSAAIEDAVAPALPTRAPSLVEPDTTDAS